MASATGAKALNAVEFLRVCGRLKVPWTHRARPHDAALDTKYVGNSRSLSCYLYWTLHSQRLKRTGWVNNHVALPESVADHMYRMGMCCMLLDESNAAVDRSKYATKGLSLCVPLSSFVWTD